MSRVTDPREVSALVTRAQEGDSEAREVLLVYVRRIVLRYCRARLGRVPGAEQAADDAAQEACLAVLSALPRYRDQGRPFEAFVYGIAAHKVADVQRAAARLPIPTADVPDQPSDSAGPEEFAVRRSDTELARALLARLPDQQREILLLRVAVGLSAEETGRMLELSPGAVRVAQHRALARLRVIATRSGRAAERGTSEEASAAIQQRSGRAAERGASATIQQRSGRAAERGTSEKASATDEAASRVDP